jgi:hypothetical protein
MAPASAARRSRGYDMRTDVNAGTRKGERGEGDYLARIEMPLGIRWNRRTSRHALTSGGAHQRHEP